MACFAVLLAAPGLSAADEETNWTVLTVARNGNWGIARARTRSEAIAGALDRCQAMTADESDCGGELVAFRSGLALALMCGDYRVIVAANDSEEADSSALERLLAFAGTLWLRFSGVQAPAAHRLLWRAHDLQGEASRRRLLPGRPEMTASSRCSAAQMAFAPTASRT
jgi:hypothetical protein